MGSAYHNFSARPWPAHRMKWTECAGIVIIESMSPARRRGLTFAAVLVAFAGLLAPLGAYAQQQQQQGGATDTHHGIGLGFGQNFLLSGPDSAFNNNIGFMVNYSFDAGPTWGLWVNLKIASYSDNTNVQDSLGVKGLVPNLRYNILKRGQFN